MTESEQVVEDVVETTEPVEDVKETTEEVKEAPKTPFRPKNLPDDEEWEFVDIEDPKVQKKFNRVYSSLQHHKRVSEEAVKTSQKLIERLEALENKVTSKEAKDIASDFESQISQLDKSRKEALKEGDHDRFVELSDKVLELKLEFKEKKKSFEEKPKEQEKKVDIKESKEAFINEVSSIDDLPEDDRELLVTWATEVDPKTNTFVRPWFNPDHKDHRMLVKIAEAVIEEAHGPVDVGELLNETDSRMRRYLGIEKPKRKPPQSINDDLPVNAKSKGLSPEQERVARMMFSNDKDPIGRYKKAMSEV